MAILESTGKISFLRVHDVGTGFGPPGDQLDVEVVVKLVTKPDMAFGFQLRNDGNRVAREGMLGLLRDANANGWNVTLDYDLPDGKKNGMLFRVAIIR